MLLPKTQPEATGAIEARARWRAGAEAQPAGADATVASGRRTGAPQNPNMKWYIIHTYSGFERKVKESLESRVRAYPELEHRSGGC